MIYVLKIDCPDRKGLVHGISGVLFRHGLNIVENEEFVDRENGHFFMRTEVEGEIDIDPVEAEINKVLLKNANIKLFKKHKKNIVILASKEYHCLGDLLVKHKFSELNANILAVVSNHEVLKEFTENFGLPYYFVPADRLSREEHEEEVFKILKNYDAEYLVLAKYMRILTGGFINYFPEKIINIHHSFLPAFIGAKPYHQAHERGVKMIGATAHFVTKDLDEGPIITQDVIQTSHKMDAAAMAKSGREVERLVLANALKLVFDDRVFVHGTKTVIL